MGTGAVAILWIIFGTIAAFVGMLILRGITSALTRKVTAGRKKIMRAATAFPFVCLAWCVAVFVFQWSVNEKFFHRDPGIGDAWKCPLPNGYAMLMIDLPDSGWVYRPAVTLDELRAAAVSLGISLALEPIGRVYARYRYSWFDVLAAALFSAPPLLGVVLLGVWIVKMRKDAMVISTPEAASRP